MCRTALLARVDLQILKPLRSGARPFWLGDAAGLEEHAEPLVVETFKANAGAFDLLHANIEALGGTVRSNGRSAGENLGLP